jgi:hypothetical protein
MRITSNRVFSPLLNVISFSFYLSVSAFADIDALKRCFDFLKSGTYYISGTKEISFEPEAGKETDPQFGPGPRGLLEMEFANSADMQAFRALRVSKNGNVEYESHATSDEGGLKNLYTSDGTTKLFFGPKQDLHVELKGLNILEVPWGWLTMKGPDNIAIPDYLSSTEGIDARLVETLPVALKGEFFELPHARGVMCKVTFNEKGNSIKEVALKAKQDKHQWLYKVIEERTVALADGKSVSLPSQIVVTCKITGFGVYRYKYSMKTFDISESIPKEIFNVDVGKAGYLWDNDAKTYLKLKANEK